MEIQKFSQGNKLFDRIYDSRTGVLNKSIHQLSGKYKIIVSSRKNGYKLFLGDYTGYKVELDTTKDFMSQVSNFLKTRTNIDTTKTLYGGYSTKGNYSWHVPVYLSPVDSNLPEYFLIMKSDNSRTSEIYSENISDLFDYSEPLDVIDLGKIYITNIFKTIQSLKTKEMYLENPVQLYWAGDDTLSSVVLHGFDYVNCCVTKKEINIKEYVQNRINANGVDDFDFFNKLILDLFEENNLIFPRFLNLEFEFDYEQVIKTDCDFQNFFGYLANSSEDGEPLSKLLKIYRHKNNTNSIDFNIVDILEPSTYTISEREETLNTIHIQDVSENDYLSIVKPKRIAVGDKIIIKSDDETIIEFVVSFDNIKDSVYQTMINIGNKITYLTNEYLTVETTTDKLWRFKCVSDFVIEFKSGNNTSFNYILVQESENINLDDVLLVDNLDIYNLPDVLLIDEERYIIDKKFKYDGYSILRLNENPQISGLTNAMLCEKFEEELYYFVCVPFLNKHNNITSLPLFNVEGYKIDIGDVIPNYSEVVPSPTQYDGDAVNITNDSECIFVSGNTNFVNIHTLNYDARFGKKNGCLEKYPSYFLIKGKCPTYLTSDYRSFRYFEDEPQIRSILKKINDSTCECIFLGTKYSLDIRYENYKLCAYIDLKAIHSDESEYYCIVDDVKKHIDIVINKPIEFDGIDTIDLSVFKNINEDFTFSESYTNVFAESGFRFGNQITNEELETIGYNERIIDNRFLVTRNKAYMDNFLTLYQNGQDVLAHYYSMLPKSENEEVLTLIFAIEFKNISNVQADSFLCDDIELRIMYTILDEWNVTDILHQYDTSGFYNEYQSFNITPDPTKHLQQKYIHQSSDFPQPIMLRRYLDEPTSVVSNIDVTNPISLKSQYFDFIYRPNGVKELFTFPEFYDPTLSQDIDGFEELINPHFDGYDYDNEFNNILENLNQEYHISLFDSNKIWDIVSVMCNDMITPHLTIEQLKSYLSTFNFDVYKSYLNNNILHILGSDDSINVRIIDIDENKDADGKDLYRYSSYYRNYLTEFSDILQFQLICPCDRLSLFSLFNFNYGYYLDETHNEALTKNITGTGIWGEVHNLVSSLYVAGDFEIKTNFEQILDVSAIISGKIYYDKMIINNENIEYLNQFTSNIEKYLKETYPKYILNNFYEVSEVFVDGLKTDFRYNKYNFKLEILKETGNNVVINLKRI